MQDSIAKCVALPAATLLMLVLGSGSALAQFGGLGGVSDALRRKVPDLLGQRPITTGLSDAKWQDASKDGFTPDEPPRSLLTLTRTANGGFVLQPGYFVEQLQSYCLMAGTYGPRDGDSDGYAYGPVKGPADDAVIAIVRSAVRHPDIAQQDVQALLWAVIARAKFEDLSPPLKAVAARLLSPRQLATLNRSALDVMSGGAMGSAIEAVPEPLRQIAQAEAQLRQYLTNPNGTYAEMERVAVLSGPLPIGYSSPVPSGRWSVHPDGYYVRYLPSGYSSTRVEIWIPRGSPAVGKEFDPAAHIAVPGNTARQRLIQSGRAQGPAAR